MLLSRLATREYLSTKLDNGLQYALIICPEAQKTSVSISIEMGHFSDPQNCQGLSHLMEHMLFAGSQKYPDGNYLNQMLNSHGGFVNAWTSSETCNVHFNCLVNQFETSLDVLVDMLSAPALSHEGIAQETDAIDAEFSMRKQDDVRRLYDVHKQTCNPEHPFSHFSVGNKSIFQQFSSTQLQEKLQAHHKRYFAAQHIKACFVIPQSMFDNKLVATIESALYQFKQSNICALKRPLPPLYLPQQKSCFIEVQPYKFAQNLMLTFCLPNLADSYRSKPILLLTHLIEDASENTLQYYLKRQGFILDITASGGIEGDNFQDININLRLSELGLQHTDQIIQTIMQWFDFLKNVGIEKWRFEEKSQQLDLQVRHAPLPSGIDEAVLLASRLHKFDLDRALDNDVVMDDYNDEVLHKFLDYFRLENLRVFCIHPNAVSHHKTKQYEVPYSTKPINLSQGQQLDCVLELPPQNPYMSDNFALVAKESKQGEMHVFDQHDFLLKFTQNHEFKTPKGDCYLSLESPQMIASPRNLAIKKLWVACLSEELGEQYNGAEMAGINFRLYGQQGGMTLHTSGFSDRQLLLCEEILRFLQNAQIRPATFRAVKEKVVASLKNTLLNKPINQLFADLNIVMQKSTFSQKAILTELEDLLLADINKQAMTYFEEVHIEGLVVGNWLKSDIQVFHSKVTRCFTKIHKARKSKREIADITEQNLCIQHAIEHKEHAIVLYFQSESSTYLERAIYIAIEKLLSPIFFDELRNKRNLGYLVGCGYFPVNKRPGLALYIQSPTHSSEVLYEAMSEVIKEFVNNIAEFEPIFDNFKQSLKKQFKIFDANTTQLAQRLWMDFEELAGSSQNNHMDMTIDSLTFDLFKQYCERLTEQKIIGNAVFVTQAETDIQNSFAGFDFIDDPCALKDRVKYQ